MAKRVALFSIGALAALALIGCSSKPSVNVINNNLGDQTTPAAAASATAAAVTTFDGEWGIRFATNPSTAKQCPPAPSRDVVMNVDQGRAQLSMGKLYSGAVNPGGEARIADRMDRSIAIIGAFRGETFVGEFRNGNCSYAVNGRKRAASP